MCNNNTDFASLGITFGRFNVLHNGHVQLFKALFQYGNRVIIGLSSHEKNLPLNIRARSIHKVLRCAGAINYRIMSANDPFDLFYQVNKSYRTQTILILGQDQTALCNNVEKHLSWKSKTIRRITSSTEIRHTIDQRNWTKLQQLVPSVAIIDAINCRKLELKTKTNHGKQQQC